MTMLAREADILSVGAFLKEQRRRIPREVLSLGHYVRLPDRRGKFVTQEELAEATGVSRGWYAMLESGAALHTSPRLLARLADALALSDESRKILFSLAIPELSVGEGAFSKVKYLSGSIVPLRTVTRRLWSATSESEILFVAAEAISGIFNDSDAAGVFKRGQPGQWNFPAFIGGHHLLNAMTELRDTLSVGLTPAQIDETMLYGMTEPGQVGTRYELHRNLSQKTRIDRTFASLGFAVTNSLTALVKSREGIAATIFAFYVDGKRNFTELDRTLLGMVADLASLALSQ
jgi:transcriptional regulator with XRE-family HTH domain